MSEWISNHKGNEMFIKRSPCLKENDSNELK